MKTLRLILLTLVFVLVSGSLVFALRAYQAEGRPFSASGVRYELWHDAGGWHLRWTGNGTRHDFTGRLWAPGGGVLLLRRVSFEPNDRAWQERRMVRFNASASSGYDGFDFRFKGRELFLELRIDGRVQLQRIFVGSEALHPEVSPFVLRREGPPGRVWVPGHYNRRGIWIPGHWR